MNIYACIHTQQKHVLCMFVDDGDPRLLVDDQWLVAAGQRHS
jgi:hypothetical protein